MQIYEDDSTDTVVYNGFIYGEKDPGYHEGVDMYSSIQNAPIYNLHGNFEITSYYLPSDINSLSRVTLYDEDLDVSYIYFHLKPNVEDLAGAQYTEDLQGAELGTENTYGNGGTHTHFEVRSGKTTSGSNALDNSLTSLRPYVYMMYYYYW